MAGTSRITLAALAASIAGDTSAALCYRGPLGPGTVVGHPAHDAPANYVATAFDEELRRDRAFGACLLLDSAIARDDRGGEPAVLVPTDLATLRDLERAIRMAIFADRSAYRAVDADFGSCVILPIVEHLRRQAEIAELFPELMAA